MSNRLRLKLLSACRTFIESFSNSIQKKMIIILIVLTCVPLVVFTVAAIHNARDRLESEIINSNTSKVHWSGTFIDDQLQILDHILFSVMANREIIDYMEDDQTSDNFVGLSWQDSILDKLSSLYLSNINRFDEIMLFNKNSERVYSVNHGEERIVQEQAAQAPWNALGPKKSIFTHGPQPDHFYMSRTFFRFIDRDVLGGVALYVKWSMFDQIFQSLKSEKNSMIFVLDQSGSMVHLPLRDSSAPDNAAGIAQEIRDHANTPFFKSDTQYIFYQSFAGGKMVLVKTIPTSVVSDSGRITLWLSIWIVCGLIAVSIIASILIAGKVTAPILKLVRAITWTEETNSDLYINHNRKDEIGLLEQKYAEMIQSRYRIFIEKRTAQLKALQAQIKPHFLHNTLQAIGAMAVVKNVPEIYNIIQAVSGNLRYTMSMGNNLVTLKQELEHVQNYLIIQSFRYKDKIEVQWDVEPGSTACLIPPLTLQPIVENAFEHAFPDKKGKWAVHITIRSTLDKVYITIEDNGMGFSKEKELEIKASLLRDTDDVIDTKESMALCNIHARFKTHFGQGYGLDIESALHRCTRVTLVLPYIPPDKGVNTND